MNWSLWGPALITLAGTIFNAGILFNKVKDHAKRISGLETKTEAHGLSIVRLEAWNDGYNAATRPPTHGTTH